VGRQRRKAKTDAGKTRSNAQGNQKQDLGERRQSLDSFDVREWFVGDPSACVSDIAAQKILREYEHPSKLWITFAAQEEKRRIKPNFEKAIPIAVEQRAARSRNARRAAIEKEVRKIAEKGIRKELGAIAQRAGQALVDDQFTPWWQCLRNYLDSFLPEEVVDRFADYLSGFVMAVENETPRGAKGEWRKVKSLLHKLNDGLDNSICMSSLSPNPPQKEALMTTLTRTMSAELFALGLDRKEVARTFLPQIWAAVGQRILPASVLRTERRSRQRTGRRK
jgi:hypothetical protein